MGDSRNTRRSRGGERRGREVRGMAEERKGRGERRVEEREGRG